MPHTNIKNTTLPSFPRNPLTPVLLHSSLPLHHHRSTTTTTMLLHHHHLFLSLLFTTLLTPSLSLNQEGLYLLEAKSSLDVPSPALSDWLPRDPTPCNWSGVTCSASNSVTSIDLSSLNLVGPFPSVLCRLPNLNSLSLSTNYISDTLPDAAVQSCTSLTHLDLSINSIVGSLPSTLHLLPSLRYLDLSSNNFSGAIPPSFALFPKLEVLSLVNNLLNETIPPFLGNITTLKQLNLSYNPFSPEPIPAELGNLTNLETLWLAHCNLVGHIPPSLGNLRRIRNLDLSTNNLDGEIPHTLTMLSTAFQIELYFNSLTGELPPGMSNLTSLRNLDVSTNKLGGTIPAELFELPLLESLNLYENRFVGNVPVSAARAKKLTELRLFKNQLTGTIPRDLGKNSPFVFVDLSQNFFTGEVPPGICDMGSLQFLMIIDNMLSGSLPEGLGQCRTLYRVRFSNNRLSGEVPAGLWGLPHIYLLDLARNSFSGSIPSTISGATNLSSLSIFNNQFSGTIPGDIRSLSKLTLFSAGNNQLTGSMPVALRHLNELEKIDLHNNSLSGEILTGVSSWTRLTDLNLADNKFTGTIPPELGDLPVLNYLDLSDNLLTGDVPPQLQNLTLIKSNFSNNNLSGKLPPQFAGELHRNSFLGNPGLCGDNPGLCPAWQGGSAAAKNHSLWVLRSIFILAGIVLVVGVAWFLFRYRKFKKAKEMDKSKWTLKSFHKLGFSEYEILESLDEDNVIGSGASGKVYKVVLSSGEAVAVKRLWEAAKKGDVDNEHESRVKEDSFEAEVATLGNIRHKNIVKLWCCCTHKDCKLLVYEYMPNGSLGDLLHSSKSGILDWPTRFKIAVDAAEGLSYLHHDCSPPIVHRDIKSNNILLDGAFAAKVADFGVAKAVVATGKGPQSMSVIAGSCGYIAPEYAYTLRVNEKSDIYSFGVVILELVTGKCPVDPEFREKDLVKWVCTTFDQKGIEHVLDPKLDLCFKDEILKVLDIGLQCASSLPINRPSMRRVVKILHEVGADSRPKPEKKDGKLSPYYYEDASDHGSVV